MSSGFSSLMKLIVSQAVSSVSPGKPMTALAMVINPSFCAVFKVLPHFQYVLAVHRERVVVEGKLTFTILVVQRLYFVDYVFWATHAVASAEHADCAAEVAPVNASSAC